MDLDQRVHAPVEAASSRLGGQHVIDRDHDDQDAISPRRGPRHLIGVVKEILAQRRQVGRLRGQRSEILARPESLGASVRTDGRSRRWPDRRRLGCRRVEMVRISPFEAGLLCSADQRMAGRGLVGQRVQNCVGEGGWAAASDPGRAALAVISSSESCEAMRSEYRGRVLTCCGAQSTGISPRAASQSIHAAERAQAEKPAAAPTGGELGNRRHWSLRAAGRPAPFAHGPTG